MSSSNLEDNIEHYKKLFIGDDTAVFRDIESRCGYFKCCLISIEGMVSQEVISSDIVFPIQRFAMDKGPCNNLEGLQFLQKSVIRSTTEVVTLNSEQTINKVLYGDSLLLVEGYSEGLIVETKGWEKRSIEEPTSERVIHGAKESFTESVITNLSLLRRKITDRALKCESIVSGKRTNTKLFMVYMKDVAPSELVSEVRNRIYTINMDAVLDAQYVVGSISDKKNSIFRLMGYSERPDVIAAKVLEGKVAIFCDHTPEVIYAPYLFYEQFMVNEDYYNNYIFAVINRVIRILSWLITTCIPAMYLALIAFHQQLLPREIFLSIATSRQGVPFPSLFELLLLLITFEILREAGTRLPKNIGDAISIVGTLILGDAAVRAQIVSAPIVIVAALAGITSMMLPQSIQALIIIRFGLLILSALFGLYGFIFGVMFLSIYLISLTSLGVPYMTFIYNIRKSKDTLFRLPWYNQKNNVKNLLENRAGQESAKIKRKQK